MIIGGYIAEVTGLSINAIEKEVRGICLCCICYFQTFLCAGDCHLAQWSYYCKPMCLHISFEAYVDEADPQNNPSSWAVDRGSSRETNTDQFVSTPGEAVTVAQQLVKTMISKGYVLSKDALIKAKAFDESHQVSSTAVAKMADLSKKIGLTDKINSGKETFKSIDEKYHVSNMTMSAASYTGRTVVAAANAVVNSSYFAKGALWFSGVLDRASKAAADLGNKGMNK